MGKRRIETQWNSFRDLVIPAHAPPVQVEEMRRAFYAGAATLFGTITMALDDSHPEPTKDDIAVMDDIAVELREYGDELRRLGRQVPG